MITQCNFEMPGIFILKPHLLERPIFKTSFINWCFLLVKRFFKNVFIFLKIYKKKMIEFEWDINVVHKIDVKRLMLWYTLNPYSEITWFALKATYLNLYNVLRIVAVSVASFTTKYLKRRNTQQKYKIYKCAVTMLLQTLQCC